MLQGAGRVERNWVNRKIRNLRPQLFFRYAYEPPGTIDAKSILVRSTPQAFREIHYQSKGQVDDVLLQTEILSIGRERVLVARVHYGGNIGLIGQDFYSFGADGPRLMHLDPLREAAKKKVPEDSVLYLPSERMDLAAGRWIIGTEPKHITIGYKVACCTGRITVNFTIENGDFGCGSSIVLSQLIDRSRMAVTGANSGNVLLAFGVE